jgi:hypothetical protein
MTARDWADEEAQGLSWLNHTIDSRQRAIASALRAAEARGYQRAQDERFVKGRPPPIAIPDAILPPTQSDGGAT